MLGQYIIVLLHILYLTCIFALQMHADDCAVKLDVFLFRWVLVTCLLYFSILWSVAGEFCIFLYEKIQFSEKNIFHFTNAIYLCDYFMIFQSVVICGNITLDG